MHLDPNAIHPLFFLSLFWITLPPPLLSVSATLILCLGFSSLFLWSLESGMSRSFIWRGTSCGPESLWRQLPPRIQHIITSSAAPMPAVSGILGTTGSTNQYQKQYGHIKCKISQCKMVFQLDQSWDFYLFIFFTAALKLFTIQEQQPLLNIPTSNCALVLQNILYCM